MSVHVGQNIASSYASRIYQSPLLRILTDHKRLGQKSGAGTYLHVKNKAVTDPALDALLAASRAESALGALIRPLEDKEIVEILLFPVVNESFRVLDEGHVLRESDVDIVSIMGYGFPTARGGILHWGKQERLFYIATRLRFFGTFFGPELAGFFEPCARLLQEAAKENTSNY